MESQDHKFTTPSGHENQGLHLCHKCGWPFPKPHPSARHRRSHKKVCGKIEGYKLSESERADNSTHSAVSDDEHHSDGDQQTPSPIGGKTIVKEISGISDKSYRSEDETYSDAVTEFSDSGISPGLEECPEGVKNLSMNVKRVDDELLKADSIGGSSNDARHATEVNNLESFESAINQAEVAEYFGTKIDCDPIKSEIPVDASLQENNTTESIEAKQVQMSSGQPSDLQELEDINTGEGLVDAVGVAVEVSQSAVSDTDGKTSNNASYESIQEAEGKNSNPLNLPSDLLEADEQATDSVPIEGKLQHDENENPDSVDLKLDLSEADVKAMDDVSGDKECEQLDKVEEDKARISDQLLDGRSQTEFSDASKTEEAREDVHVVSLAKDLPTSDNPELLLKDFKAYNKFKSSLPLDLGSSEPEPLSTDGDPSKNSLPSGFPTDHSNGVYGGSQTEFSDASKTEEAREDVHVVSLAKDLPASDNAELLLKDFKDYNKFKSSLPLDLGSSEPEPLSTDGDPSKNSLPSGSPTDHSDMNTITSSVQEEARQTTKVDDPVIERTETIFSMEEENKGGNPENELLANKETTVVDTSCLSANQTMVTHDEHEKARTEQPIGETAKERIEEKLEGVFEVDKTICLVGGHNDRAILTGTTVHESRDEILDSTVSNNAKVLEPASATELDSKIIGDCDVKEPAGLLVDTDLDGRVVDNSHAGDGVKNATGVISSASLNEGNDKLIKQNDTVSAVDISTNSSSRADSLDANWGSVSVLSTQSESTAVPDAEATDTCEKSERDLQKPTSGVEERYPDKSDVYEPPSFMTLVESGENADKKASAPEIEAQLIAQQPKTEALKAGWFPSITNVVNESQGRKKNEEIIAKVTNWSTGKQHTPLKNLLGEAKSPNTKQVPSVNQKDETAATKKNGATTVTTVNSILSSEAPTEQAAASKEAEKEWNSPARYPVDIKKEKRKTKPYWVPFVCCSSVHQDA
ncbi:PREDICTED: uncharacterized protein LOC109216274 isoform X2 [Nicotiana attenuata]|uniref:uncharacterized protein LOC109216274 isoform X2 n=1 Tax=Nicotiana attenuata TaxID=49451 RepID=UPI000904D68E|nr:PREDICTED: uncharacterized protein LOC109216274 isoform X2 [Nicotiana attenuata]